jgi:hypothetical protein
MPGTTWWTAATGPLSRWMSSPSSARLAERRIAARWEVLSVCAGWRWDRELAAHRALKLAALQAAATSIVTARRARHRSAARGHGRDRRRSSRGQRPAHLERALLFPSRHNRSLEAFTARVLHRHWSVCPRLILDTRSLRRRRSPRHSSLFVSGSAPTRRRSPSSFCVAPKQCSASSRHKIAFKLGPSRRSLIDCARGQHRTSTRSAASGTPADIREQKLAAARYERVLAPGQPATR